MATERIHQQGSLASLRKGPMRKTSTRYTTKPPTNMPDFELIKPGSQTTSVVISVTETHTAPAPTSQEAPVLQKPGSLTTSIRTRPQPPPLTIPTKAHLSQKKPELIQEPNAPRAPAVSEPAPAVAAMPAPPSSGKATASVPSSKECEGSPPAETPVMRSMFPTYDHNVTLGQQDYRPNITSIPESLRATGQPGVSNNPYRNKSFSATPRAGPSATNPIDSRESPLRRSDSLKREGPISKPEQLVKLWDIANGQGYQNTDQSYTLELSCDNLTPGREIINFSTSDSVNMYTLAASPDLPSVIQTSRANPVQKGTRIPICSASIASPSRQDPLISSMFPKLAGLMALDQSSNEAISQGLNRSASDLLQRETIERAQEREASMLLWDADSDRFCILHPTLLDNAATSLAIEITPNPLAPEQISIFAPETQTPLLSLDMKTLILTIHAQSITALPSLYILDTLMTGLLTLLLHLHRLCAKAATPTTSSPRPQPQAYQEDLPTTTTPPLYFPPPPSSQHSRNGHAPTTIKIPRPALFRSHRSTTTTTAPAPAPAPTPRSTHSALVSPTPFSIFLSTFSSNRHNNKHHHSTSSQQDKDIELGDMSTDGTSLSTSTSLTKQKPPKKGLYSAEDENLPAGTRAVLRFLYWVFEVLYWVLGLLVQLLAAAVVAGGKLVTKL